MKNEQKNDIQALVNQKLEVTQTSQNQASKQMGISVASLNNCLNNNWQSISDEMWRKISLWVDYSPLKWKTKSTRNLDLICKLCEDAQMNNRFLATAGYSGAGKTTALKYYSNKTPNSFYVLCTKTMARKEFLKAIAQSLGVDVEGNIHVKVKAIVNKLASMENPLLILDDAGKLMDGCLMLIQVIYDELEFRLGMVMGGTPSMKNYIFKMAAKDKPGFRELKRRIGFWQRLYPITFQFVCKVCNEYGITDPKAQKLVGKMVGDLGTLRELLTNYSKADHTNADQVEVLARLNVGSTRYDQTA